MAHIIHPTLTEGVIKSHFGVVFTDGVADVDLDGRPNLERFYRTHGYTIEESGGQSKTDLQAIARDLDIPHTQRTTRAELASLIADKAVIADPNTGGPAVDTPEA